MTAYDFALLDYSTERSTIEQRIKALITALESEGVDKAAIVFAVQQTLTDLCLEDDDLPVSDKIEVMRHCGRTFLAIVEEIEHRIDGITRSRAAGLPDSSRN